MSLSSQCRNVNSLRRFVMRGALWPTTREGRLPLRSYSHQQQPSKTTTTLISAASLLSKDQVPQFNRHLKQQQQQPHLKSSQQASSSPTIMKTIVSSINNNNSSNADKSSPSVDKNTFAGEDSCFFSVNGQSVGVADGVGAWKSKGFDSSMMSRSLMNHCQFLIDSNTSNAYNVLNDAYQMIKDQNLVPAGSTTACCLSISHHHHQQQPGQPGQQEQEEEHVTIVGHNLGDSGFIVIRPGQGIVYKSTYQWHTFNVPYVLTILPREWDREKSTMICDEPSSAETTTMKVKDGDIIVVGTDGLWANVHPCEIESWFITNKEDNTLHRKSVSYLSRFICEQAVRKSSDPYVDDSSIPFVAEAEKFGVYWSGGQVDDITVLVSRVSSLTATPRIQ